MCAQTSAKSSFANAKDLSRSLFVQTLDLKLSSGLSLHRLIMENRLREGDPTPSANSVLSLRSRSSAEISNRPEVIIPVLNIRAIALKHAVVPDSPDLVNAFLTKDFQSPNTSPTFAGFLQDTPSTLPPTKFHFSNSFARHRWFRRPACRLPNPDRTRCCGSSRAHGHEASHPICPSSHIAPLSFADNC